MTLAATRRAITTGVDVVEPPIAPPLHAHDAHELLWAVDGSFRIEAAGRSWSMVPGGALWVSAGTPHRTAGARRYACGWALIDPEVCPMLWERTAPLSLGPLLRHLFAHLARDSGPTTWPAAETLALALLGEQLSSGVVELRLPRDERCQRIVDALLEDPAHPWDLADWAGVVGASSRTLSRLFLAETGLSFGQWRTHARMRAAIAELERGVPVAAVARRVGYATASAFVTAFRRCTGRTPGSVAEEASDLRIVS
jgi:AraC-like DNA-binding protein